jgi:hypothetical protein
MREPGDIAQEGEIEQKYVPEDASSGTSVASRGCGLIGCLLIIATFVAFGVGIYVLGNKLEPLADRFLWAPHDVVREYLAAYEAADTERAGRFVCADVPSGRLPDPAAPLGGPTAWTSGVDDQFPYPRPDGRVAIYYQVTSGVGTRRGQALLVREDDGWRICEFTT